MAVLEVAVPERALELKIGVVDEDLVAGGQVDAAAVEGDPPKAPVGSTPFPADRGVIPIDPLLDHAGRDVQQEDAPMALSLMAGANHRTHHDAGHATPRRTNRVSS